MLFVYLHVVAVSMRRIFSSTMALFNTMLEMRIDKRAVVSFCSSGNRANLI